jgi:hypothetical protein
MYAITLSSRNNVEFTAFLLFSQHNPRSESDAALGRHWLAPAPCTGYLAHPFGKSRCKEERVYLHWLQMDVHRVQPLAVVDNSDLSANHLTALVTPFILASQGNSSGFPFETARVMMALHVFVFVFLLVVCLFLSLARLGRRDWYQSSAFLLTRRSQAQQAPPSAEAPLPRRLPRLSSRLHSLGRWRASACSCTPLEQGQKPPRSTQASGHRGLCLSQSAVCVLRDHRCSRPRVGWRWQAWTCRADPDLSLPGLPYHVQCPAQHSVISPENPLSQGRSGTGRAGRRVGSFGCRTGLRLSTSHHHHLAVARSPSMLRHYTSTISAPSSSRTCSWMKSEPGCAAPNRSSGCGWPLIP